ncbi:hypothetical protein P4U90_02560 [Cytobacillus kochii]|nr:hypothetical protein [Cytobacillus kochii]
MSIPHGINIKPSFEFISNKYKRAGYVMIQTIDVHLANHSCQKTKAK